MEALMQMMPPLDAVPTVVRVRVPKLPDPSPRKNDLCRGSHASSFNRHVFGMVIISNNIPMVSYSS